MQDIRRIAVFPHEYEQLTATAAHITPDELIHQLARLERQRLRTLHRYQHAGPLTRWWYRSTLIELTFQINHRLLLRKAQLGTLPKVHDISFIDPPA